MTCEPKFVVNSALNCAGAVSYTHLDVYKRQGNGNAKLVTAIPESVVSPPASCLRHRPTSFTIRPSRLTI